MSKNYKISVIGAGNVGGMVAFLLALKSVGDVVLVDIDEGRAQGKAMDISHASSIEGFQGSVVGTSSFEEIAGSDVVVITSGFPRTNGMTNRSELLEKNFNIVREVAASVAKYAPETFVITATNPLDAMTWLAKEVMRWPAHRIVGMGGCLDSARLSYFLSVEAGIYPKQFDCMMLGAHGDTMFGVLGATKLDGLTGSELIELGDFTQQMFDSAELKARQVAMLICKLTNSSTYYAPGSAIVEVVRAYLGDSKKLIPCSVYLEGSYQTSGICIGVPAVIGRTGVERVVELNLSDRERASFAASVADVRATVDALRVKLGVK